jgi:hypothetical protein
MVAAGRVHHVRFAVPISAALGLMWVWRRLEQRRAIAIGAIGVLTF